MVQQCQAGADAREDGSALLRRHVALHGWKGEQLGYGRAVTVAAELGTCLAYLYPWLNSLWHRSMILLSIHSDCFLHQQLLDYLHCARTLCAVAMRLTGPASCTNKKLSYTRTSMRYWEA